MPETYTKLTGKMSVPGPRRPSRRLSPQGRDELRRLEALAASDPYAEACLRAINEWLDTGRPGSLIAAIDRVRIEEAERRNESPRDSYSIRRNIGSRTLVVPLHAVAAVGVLLDVIERG